GLLQLENEARLRFDKVGVLVAFCDGLRRNVITTDFACYGCKILGGRDDIEFALRAQRQTQYEKRNECGQTDFYLHISYLKLVRTMRPNRELELHQELVGSGSGCILSAPVLST